MIENQSPYEGKDPVSGISIGADYVLSDKISIYSEWAQLIGKTDNDQNLGNGIIFPGLSYRFKNGKFKLEGRHILSNNFHNIPPSNFSDYQLVQWHHYKHLN